MYCTVLDVNKKPAGIASCGGSGGVWTVPGVWEVNDSDACEGFGVSEVCVLEGARGSGGIWNLYFPSKASVWF